MLAQFRRFITCELRESLHLRLILINCRFLEGKYILSRFLLCDIVVSRAVSSSVKPVFI